MPESVGAPTLEAPVVPLPGGGIGGGLEKGPTPMGGAVGGDLGSLAGKIEGFGAPPSMPEIKLPEIGEAGIGEVPDAASLAQLAEAKLGTPEVGIKEVAGINIPGQEAPVPPPAQGEGESATTASNAAGAEAQKGTEALKGETKPPPPSEAGKAEVPPSPAVEGQGKPPVEPAAKPPEDSAKAKRTQELEEKVKSRTATAEEMRELRDLKKDPEDRRKDLEQKALDGTITDDEIQELEKLNAPEDLKNLTPEQQMEKLQKDIDDLGTELMRKMANGEEVTQEDLEKLRNLRGQESLINNGFTPDQTRSLGKVAEKMRSKLTERQSRIAKEIQEEIQELMALELYLLSIPKTVEQLRSQAKAIKEKADAKHNEAEGARGQDRLRKKQEEYSLYLQLLNAKEAIRSQKRMPSRIEARRQDLEQAVRRKLGVTHGLRTLVEWGAAKVKSIDLEIGEGIEDTKDIVFGAYT